MRIVVLDKGTLGGDYSLGGDARWELLSWRGHLVGIVVLEGTIGGDCFLGGDVRWGL